MPDTVRATFAGICLDLVAPPSRFMREDSLWRLKQHYEPFLATCSLPAEGVAVDIGAGFGTFAVPFARRYPRWRLWCFEPDADSFAALCTNIDHHGMSNVTALPVAVADAGEANDALVAALLAGDCVALRALCPELGYRRHCQFDGFLDAQVKTDADFTPIDHPTLPADALRALQPSLLKLIAPHAEEEILSALSGVEPNVLLGETWSPLLPRRLTPKTSAAWMPFARAPRLALRRLSPMTHQEGALGVIIDVGDASDAVLAATLATVPTTPEIAVHLVVPPRRSLPVEIEAMQLRVHQADQPGSAAAFNLGRRRSDTSHIAFLKAGDLPAPDSLEALHALAQLSGSEIVQGGGAGGPAWTDLPREGTFDLAGIAGSFMPAGQLLAHFAPSRARLYRRDFLDARALWFSEHLRAFDDHHLHFLTLLAAKEVPVLPGARIITPAPARLLGTEAFYLPEAFRLVIKRVMIEGWISLAPLFEGFARAARATALQLSPPLQRDFLEALAEILLSSEKALGPEMPCRAEQVLPELPSLSTRITTLRAQRAEMSCGYAWGWMDAPVLQAPMVAQDMVWRTED